MMLSRGAIRLIILKSRVRQGAILRQKSTLENRDRMIRESAGRDGEALERSNAFARRMVLGKLSNNLKCSILKNEELLQREHLLQRKLEAYD